MKSKIESQVKNKTRMTTSVEAQLKAVVTKKLNPPQITAIITPQKWLPYQIISDNIV